jgi:penicillin-binding protein 1C
MLGPESVYAGLNRIGLRLSESAGYHGHAMALGSADVTLLDLTNAYRTLANGGQAGAVRWQLEGPAPAPAAVPRVYEPEVAFIVADILADPAARALTFGLDSPLVTRGWAAVKTGTSKDLRDNWCLGFSDRYTVGVWVGNANGAPMHAVSGISGAAPVWHAVMAYLHAGQPSRAPAAPTGLRRSAGEWLLAGTEPPDADPRGPVAAAGRRARPFGIQSPREGTVVMLDPDIPQQAQQLVFEGAPGQWRLDGQALGAGSVLRWLPRPGRHVLEWRDAEGAAHDRVAFEVRASPGPRSLRRRPG